MTTQTSHPLPGTIAPGRHAAADRSPWAALPVLLAGTFMCVLISSSSTLRSARSLRFFSTMTTFGTAADVTVAELSVEAFFPADAATTAALAAVD